MEPIAETSDATAKAERLRFVLGDRQRCEEKALALHEMLCSEYGCPIAYFHSLDPLSELISSLLSHRTRNSDSGKAFKAIRAKYPDWAAVRDADVAELEETISRVTWPELKAQRIKDILRRLTEELGEPISLDFLADLPIDEARSWLQRLPGVGPKTSAAVLSFSLLRGAALPVDSHHHRVAQRVGLISGKMDVGPSHAALAALIPEDWDAQHVYDHHEVFMLHGQKICLWQSPRCQSCVIADYCDAYQRAKATGQAIDPRKPK